MTRNREGNVLARSGSCVTNHVTSAVQKSLGAV
jgi:hypothetical protein